MVSVHPQLHGQQDKGRKCERAGKGNQWRAGGEGAEGAGGQGQEGWRGRGVARVPSAATHPAHDPTQLPHHPHTHTPVVLNQGALGFHMVHARHTICQAARAAGGQELADYQVCCPRHACQVAQPAIVRGSHDARGVCACANKKGWVDVASLFVAQLG